MNRGIFLGTMKPRGAYTSESPEKGRTYDAFSESSVATRCTDVVQKLRKRALELQPRPFNSRIDKVRGHVRVTTHHEEVRCVASRIPGVSALSVSLSLARAHVCVCVSECVDSLAGSVSRRVCRSSIRLGAHLAVRVRDLVVERHVI